MVLTRLRGEGSLSGVARVRGNIEEGGVEEEFEREKGGEEKYQEEREVCGWVGNGATKRRGRGSIWCSEQNKGSVVCKEGYVEHMTRSLGLVENLT